MSSILFARFFSGLVALRAWGILAICAGLLGFAEVHADSASTKVNPVVLVVGDSLSAAYGIPEKAGWVHLLRQRLAENSLPYDVINASISGDTTRGGVTRIGAALKQYQPAVVVIELGGNDGLRGFPIDSARANLETMVRTARKANAKPLIVGVELPPNYGPVYTRRFAAMFKDVAKKYDVPVVPSLLADFGNKRELFQADTIHPVAAAQPIMLENVWKELQPLLQSRVLARQQ
ncbi:MAG: arylesterase [Burkholderiales bacterium]|nr:arylesterase [Burkholderiales bacterium]